MSLLSVFTLILGFGLRVESNRWVAFDQFADILTRDLPARSD
jgi:hypothetical protein